MYGLKSKIHLIVDVHDMPVKIFATKGVTVNYVQACRFVIGIDTLDTWMISLMIALWKKYSANSI